MVLLGKSNVYTDRAWQMALFKEGLRLRPNQANLHQVFSDFSRWFSLDIIEERDPKLKPHPVSFFSLVPVYPCETFAGLCGRQMFC